MKRVKVELKFPAVVVSKIIDVETKKNGDISAKGKKVIDEVSKTNLFPKLMKRVEQSKVKMIIRH